MVGVLDVDELVEDELTVLCVDSEVEEPECELCVLEL